MTVSLVDKVKAVASALDGRVPYAFGGAIALAYATEEPRGTRDLDVNVFVAAADVDEVFAALPSGVVHGDADRAAVLQDEQVRLWWDDTPVDVFFAAHPFHVAAGQRSRTVDFDGTPIRVLAPDDLAVFKVLFDRPKDWVDIATMIESGTLDVDAVARQVEALLGDDPRVGRVRSM
ncbi:MAG: hypothetical protein QM733_06680 [Ilumatobacteraceae bacterium]